MIAKDVLRQNTKRERLENSHQLCIQENSETIPPGAQAFQKLDAHNTESRDGVALEGFYLPAFSVQEGSRSGPGN